MKQSAQDRANRNDLKVESTKWEKIQASQSPPGNKMKASAAAGPSAFPKDNGMSEDPNYAQTIRAFKIATSRN